MSTFEEIFERIKSATGTRTQVELAEVLEIRQSSISDAKRRNSVPAEWYMKLFDRFGLNPDWLKKGEGPMYLRTEQGYEAMDRQSTLNEPALRYTGQEAKSAIVAVHSLCCDANADGTPALQAIGKVALPLSFVTPGVQVVLLDAASMEPLIHKGAYVGIDTTQPQVIAGELYGVCLPVEGLSIKRIFFDTAHKNLILRSENPGHPELVLPIEQRERAITGRVVWVLQRM